MSDRCVLCDRYTGQTECLYCDAAHKAMVACYGTEPTVTRLIDVDRMIDELDIATIAFKKVLAEYRGGYGRDAVRRKPQGLLLDSLDAGAPDTHHDESATGRRPWTTRKAST